MTLKIPTTAKPVRSLSVADRIVASSEYALFLEDYAYINRRLNVRELVEEVLRMEVKRKIKHMTSANILADAQHELIEGNAQNMAFRSRVNEIRVTLFIASSELEELIDRFWKWASSKYMHELNTMKLKSENTRWAYIGTIISKQQRRLTRINSAMKVCELFIEDYEAAGYSLMRINAVLQSTMRDR